MECSFERLRSRWQVPVTVAIKVMRNVETG